MIEYISGKLVKKTPSQIIVDLNGMGYIINCSVNCYDKLPKLDSEIFILIYFHIHENNQELYGFIDDTERHLFKLLIGISGIGPKTAIILLSSISPGEFKKRLIAGEVTMLTALPGIGPKTARRIIVELKDKFVKMSPEELPKEDIDLLPGVSDAYDALLALGFPMQDIRSAIGKIQQDNKGIDTEKIIKKVLAQLQ